MIIIKVLSLSHIHLPPLLAEDASPSIFSYFTGFLYVCVCVYIYIYIGLCTAYEYGNIRQLPTKLENQDMCQQLNASK